MYESHTGVTEQPFSEGGLTYTARATPGTDPQRWIVFLDGQFTPAGYLEEFYSAQEFGVWRLRVFDNNNRRIGDAQISKRGGSEDLASVGTYSEALFWIRSTALDA